MVRNPGRSTKGSRHAATPSAEAFGSGMAELNTLLGSYFRFALMSRSALPP
jgi:hypothetical protein